MMITTIFATEDNPTGLRDSSEFEHTHGIDENETAVCHWDEYKVPETGLLVHRSVHAYAKHGWQMPAVETGTIT